MNLSGLNKVFCPYCGHEMELDSVANKLYWYVCGNQTVECSASTPYADTPDEAYKKAKAIYRPLLKPVPSSDFENLLSEKERWEMHHGTLKYVGGRPLYLETPPLHNGIAVCKWMKMEEIREYISDIGFFSCDYNRTLRFWPEEPTEEERDAAKWEDEA